MKQYHIVAIEITNEDKTPELKYFTVGGEDLVSQTQDEIVKMALNAIKDISGTKEIKFVEILPEEEFNRFFHSQLKDQNNFNN